MCVCVCYINRWSKMCTCLFDPHIQTSQNVKKMVTQHYLNTPQPPVSAEMGKKNPFNHLHFVWGERTERVGGRYLWWTWYPAALTFHPGSVGLGIFAVLAIRCWTSLHVSVGLGRDTWNRISSNVAFLQPVFSTLTAQKPQRKHFNRRVILWNEARGGNSPRTGWLGYGA